MTNMTPNKFEAKNYIPSELPFSIRLDRNGPDVYPCGKPELHQRDFWKIVYIVSGSGILLINGRRCPFSAGFVCLIHPDDLTTWELTEKITLYNILFLQRFIADSLKKWSDSRGFFSIFEPRFQPERSLNHELLHLLDANRSIFALIRKMSHEYEQPDIHSGELLRLYLLELLIGLARLSFHSYVRRRKDEVAGFIRSYLESDCREPLNIRKIAEETGFSRGYLLTLYKQKTGETIGTTLLKIRIRKALQLLFETNLTIERICYECGFSDPANFYRTFKRETGMNPGACRRQNRLRQNP